jgi:hypothetical protein
VKKFWSKINQVVAYKQKLEADETRQKVRSTTIIYTSGFLLREASNMLPTTQVRKAHDFGIGPLDQFW